MCVSEFSHTGVHILLLNIFGSFRLLDTIFSAFFLPLPFPPFLNPSLRLFSYCWPFTSFHFSSLFQPLPLSAPNSPSFPSLLIFASFHISLGNLRRCEVACMNVLYIADLSTLCATCCYISYSHSPDPSPRIAVPTGQHIIRRVTADVRTGK